MSIKYTTRTASETRRLAAAVASLLEPGDMILFDGTLGAGKTTFVQGLVEALGITGPATSPTFALAHHYGHPVQEALIAPSQPSTTVPTAFTPAVMGWPSNSSDPIPLPTSLTSLSHIPYHTLTTPTLLVHVDLYRMVSFAEIDDLALDEALDAGAVVCIEWGAEGLQAFKEDHLVITIEPDREYRNRIITLDAKGPGWERRLDSGKEVLARWVVSGE
ncbi:MAG: tRNA (adenosine(37)-N6)-threonylcarbamoyltransferase complex ATPase subunit type 1 TsaE [Actinobacteria bacterium]|nr:tRNA (adenosine(37)-N6)-threonylcarbamoyltransferase complex ATPase subunit type 1 TsaE [Actinomycetota bacterium]MCL5446563.1 tRNA (adenosine(37)-N6)-threonylcarbamoyltransferase complex ATPase subunit type 1 TsaE [Actinomycetota bacterium]